VIVEARQPSQEPMFDMKSRSSAEGVIRPLHYCDRDADARKRESCHEAGKQCANDYGRSLTFDAPCVSINGKSLRCRGNRGI
jgi:hypothetical protein